MGSASTPSSRRQHLARPIPHPRISTTTVPPRSTVYVVERLGRLSRLLHPSSDAAPLLPFVDKVVAAYTTRRVQQNTPASGLLALAAGRRQVHVHATWTVRVLDPRKLAYRIADVDRCIHMLVHVRIRDALAALPPHALHTLSTPTTLAAMSDEVRQNVDETAHKFGVSCSALTISAIQPVKDPNLNENLPKTTTIDSTVAPISPNSDNTQQTPKQRPRSLNLADSNESPPIPLDPNEFDTVLPELPGHISPTKFPFPHNFDHMSDDAHFLDDSSTENRPENTPVSRKDVSPRPPRTPIFPIKKDALYAPPPSPSREESQKEAQPITILPTLISSVLTKEQLEDASANQLPATDSSHDDDDLPPTLPPSPTSLPPSPTPLPPSPKPLPPDDSSSANAVPNFAKYLESLPPTPPTDLPSSDSASDPPGEATDNTTSREVGDETVAMDTRFPRKSDEPGDSNELPDTESQTLPSVPLDGMDSNPFDPVEPVDSVELLRSPSGNSNPASIATAPVDDDSDGLSNKAVLDKDVDEIDEPSSSSLVEEDVSRSLPVSSSVKRDPRRRRQQLPTASVFQSVIGKAERAIKSATTDLIEGPMRLINAQSNTQRITGESGSSPNDARKVLGPRTAKNDIRKPSTRPTPVRMEGERKPSTPTVLEYPQPEGHHAEEEGQREVPVTSKHSQPDKPTDERTTRSVPVLIEYPQPAQPLENRSGLPLQPRSAFDTERQNFDMRRAQTPRHTPMPHRTLHPDLYRPEARRGTAHMPPSMRGPMRMEHYDSDIRRLPAPIPTPIYIEKAHEYSVSSSSRPKYPDVSESSREYQAPATAAPSIRGEDEHTDQRRFRSNSDVEERRRRREDSALRSRREEELLSSREHARREKLMDTLDTIEKSHRDAAPFDDEASTPDKRDTVVETGSDSDHDVFLDAKDAVTSWEYLPSPEPRHSSKRRHKSRHARKHSRNEDGYFAEGSSSEEECRDCGRRHHDSHDVEEPHRRKGRSRSKSESAKHRIQEEGDDSGSDAFSEHHSSRSRGRSEKRSGESQRSERLEHSSRDRSHRNKKYSSKERKNDRTDRSEKPGRPEKAERREKLERAERRERGERAETSERSEKEHMSRRNKSGEKKRSHDKEKSRSKKTLRESDTEQKKREPGGRSRKKHRRPPSPPSLQYTNYCTEAKSIYRHRLPDSDSGVDNPIPWYCEGQSAPDDTDVDIGDNRSSESESNMMDSVQTETTTYSSYGRRDKNGRRRRAHHNRSVTFLYDDL